MLLFLGKFDTTNPYQVRLDVFNVQLSFTKTRKSILTRTMVQFHDLHFYFFLRYTTRNVVLFSRKVDFSIHDAEERFFANQWLQRF